MKVTFDYNREKDIWCLLNKGKSSNNSQTATKVYQELVEEYGESPTNELTDTFIDKYISGKHIDLQNYLASYQKDWDVIAIEYQKKAEEIFAASLTKNIMGYLTINNRCPYSIEDNYFFVTVPTLSSRKTVMHELWHFYTWQKFGADCEEKLGKQKYNDIKEALTVLLNIECGDLLPEGVTDDGYPQHKELREKISQIWTETRNIEDVWNRAIEYYTSIPNQGYKYSPVLES